MILDEDIKQVIAGWVLIGAPRVSDYSLLPKDERHGMIYLAVNTHIKDLFRATKGLYIKINKKWVYINKTKDLVPMLIKDSHAHN